MRFLLLLPLLTSCNVIPMMSDIQAIHDDLDAFIGGEITGGQTLVSIGQTMQEIEARPTPMTTTELIMAGLAMVTGATGAAGVGVNRFRNMKRVKRGEAV